MTNPRSLFLSLGLATVATAQPPTVQISIGVRETGFAGGSFTAIGGDGGVSGGIEWINMDGQFLTLDGTWQQFTFNLTTDPIHQAQATSSCSPGLRSPENRKVSRRADREAR